MQFKTEPFSHQREQFEYLTTQRREPYYGVLWEQGTGKTKLGIDYAADLWGRRKIDAVLVVAPNGVDLNWLRDEIPLHLPDAAMADSRLHRFAVRSSKTKWHKRECEQLLKHEGLAWLLISYNAFMSNDGKKFLRRFLGRRECLYILDESHNIKTPNAKRTKSVVASGKYAPYRQIMTGTLIGNGPFDAYSQMRFLDEEFWKREVGISTFTEFKQRYGEWFTRAQANEVLGYDPGYDKLVRYRNLDELKEIIARHTHRVRKEDVLDLPEKLFTRRYFEMTPRQRRHYDELREEYETELSDGTLLEADLALVRLLRLQQITCGYVKVDVDEPEVMIDDTNPRIELMEELRDELPGQKVVVRARFRKDVDQLMDLLGRTAVRCDGKVDDEQTDRNLTEFKEGDAQWLVASMSKATEGHTWTMAHTQIYYSSDFSLLKRLQTEDRLHRSGQRNAVNYIDLAAVGTVDEKIVRALVNKLEIASLIQGDGLRDWL